MSFEWPMFMYEVEPQSARKSLGNYVYECRGCTGIKPRHPSKSEFTTCDSQCFQDFNTKEKSFLELEFRNNDTPHTVDWKMTDFKDTSNTPETPVYFQTSCTHGVKLNGRGVKKTQEQKDLSDLCKNSNRNSSTNRSRDLAGGPSNTLDTEQCNCKSSRILSILRKLTLSKKQKQKFQNQQQQKIPSLEKKSSSRRWKTQAKEFSEAPPLTQNPPKRVFGLNKQKKIGIGRNFRLPDKLSLASHDLFDYVSPKVETGVGMDFRDRWNGRRGTRKEEFFFDRGEIATWRPEYGSNRRVKTKAHASYQYSSRKSPQNVDTFEGKHDNMLSSITDPYSSQSRLTKHESNRCFEFHPNLTRKTTSSASTSRCKTATTNNNPIEFVPSPTVRATVSAERFRQKSRKSYAGQINLTSPYALYQDISGCPLDYIAMHGANALCVTSGTRRNTQASTESSPTSNSTTHFGPFVVQTISSPNVMPVTSVQSNTSTAATTATGTTGATIFPFFPLTPFRMCCCSGKHMIREEQYRELRPRKLEASYQHISIPQAAHPNNELVVGNDQRCDASRLDVDFSSKNLEFIIKQQKSNLNTGVNKNENQKLTYASSMSPKHSPSTSTFFTTAFHELNNHIYTKQPSIKEELHRPICSESSDQTANSTVAASLALKLTSFKDQCICVPPVTANKLARHMSECLSSSVQQNVTISPNSFLDSPKTEPNYFNRRYSEAITITPTISPISVPQVIDESDCTANEISHTERHKFSRFNPTPMLNIKLSKASTSGILENLTSRTAIAGTTRSDTQLRSKDETEEADLHKLFASKLFTQPAKGLQNLYLNFNDSGSHQRESYFKRNRKLMTRLTRKQRSSLLLLKKKKFSDVKIFTQMSNESRNNFEQSFSKENSICKSRSTPCFAEDQLPAFISSHSSNTNIECDSNSAECHNDSGFSSPVVTMTKSAELGKAEGYLKRFLSNPIITAGNAIEKSASNYRNSLSNEQESEGSQTDKKLEQEHCFAELALLQKQKQLEKQNEIWLSNQGNLKPEKSQSKEQVSKNELGASKEQVMQLLKFKTELLAEKKKESNLTNSENSNQSKFSDTTTNRQDQKATDTGTNQQMRSNYSKDSWKHNTIEYIKDIPHRFLFLIPKTPILTQCLSTDSCNTAGIHSEIRVGETDSHCPILVHHKNSNNRSTTSTSESVSF